jgi:exopolyphosphatase / guanosine-5'-triphosphate,3'-diphosphate pyrophosphatase
MESFTTIAAVDLGSNSFRLQMARIDDDQVYPLDSLREAVRLAAGLTPEKLLDEMAQVRAVECLQRFGERLRGLPHGAVRAVGTNTLRVAKNAREFIPRFEEALGFPIEVVAGREEARLIYLGVTHSLPPSQEKRLVVDIGGGSTEFIIGAGHQPHRLESLYMGCVSYTLKYFEGGRLSKANLKQAELAARIELETIKKQFSRKQWQQAVGSSGTARAIGDILGANGWSVGDLNREGMERLRAGLIKAGHLDRVALPGLRDDRVAVLPGGFAIMNAIFEELGVEQMALANGAMRQGILWDMVGRAHRRDMREQTVRQFMKRYHVDSMHAHRVERLALKIYSDISNLPGEEIESPRMLLSWAARLHEIGLSVAHSGFHKHSAYIIANADMPGFSKMEQQHLAMLVLAHRGGLSKLRGLVRNEFDWSLLVAMRVAVLLNRSRTEARLPSMHASRRKSSFVIELDQRWLEANPLTSTELRLEIRAWTLLGIELSVPQLAELETELQGAD